MHIRFPAPLTITLGSITFFDVFSLQPRLPYFSKLSSIIVTCMKPTVLVTFIIITSFTLRKYPYLTFRVMSLHALAFSISHICTLSWVTMVAFLGWVAVAICFVLQYAVQACTFKVIDSMMVVLSGHVQSAFVFVPAYVIIFSLKCIYACFMFF